MAIRQVDETTTEFPSDDDISLLSTHASLGDNTPYPSVFSTLAALDQVEEAEVPSAQNTHAALELSGQVDPGSTIAIASIPALQFAPSNPVSQELVVPQGIATSIQIAPASSTANASPASDIISMAGSKITFHNTYGAGVTAAFHQAVIDAEHFIEAHLTTGKTVDLFASFDFASLGPSFSGENNFTMYTESYAAWRAQMVAHATSADDAAAVAALPTVDPTGGLGVSLPSGYARMMGMNVGNDVDAIVLNSDLIFNFANGDATGVLEHELTEGAMGRVSSLGFRTFTDGTHFWNPMDFFRFTAGGAHDFTGGKDGVKTFFGFDSSHVFTNLQYHNSINAQGQYDGFDLADWDHTVGDAFGPGGPGSPGSMGATDLRLMDVLGWTATNSAGTLTASQVNSIYQAVLARSASQAEITNALTTDAASGDGAVVASVVNSAEAQQDVYPVARIVLLATNSLPTATQLSGWTQFLESAGTGVVNVLHAETVMANAFVDSTFFHNTYGNMAANAPVTAAFMSTLIQNATGIAATQNQINTWVGTGLTVAQVFSQFATGDQYAAATLSKVQSYLTAAADNAAHIPVVGSIDVAHLSDFG